MPAPKASRPVVTSALVLCPFSSVDVADVEATVVVVPADVSQADALAAARADEKVAPHLEGKTIVKEVVVPGRLVNFVVK